MRLVILILTKLPSKFHHYCQNNNNIIIVIIINISPNKDIDQQFAESLAAVKDKINTITNNNNIDDGFGSGTITNTDTISNTNNEGLSKFQQQLSGNIIYTTIIIIN